ncbi:Hypothetical_protein [Hexamita inflata]|uniref:Hypothetical_protein n=1 Tax=Hexamita inflata TaxID=28002 RepID=A0AA86UAE4_9EUKA|nr:Hypothetical protein HINF_LOCUS31262 [Hexamita inflata]
MHIRCSRTVTILLTEIVCTVSRKYVTASLNRRVDQHVNIIHVVQGRCGVLRLSSISREMQQLVIPENKWKVICLTLLKLQLMSFCFEQSQIGLIQSSNTEAMFSYFL